MGERTAISWTDSTWTPIRARNRANGKVGHYCEHVTPGCEFCYAEAMNRRLGTGIDFKRQNRERVEIFLDEKMILAPLRWKKPRRIFVCSMTDLFADFVPDTAIDQVFAVMALCPQHQFQVLTKRADRMQEYVGHSFDEQAQRDAMIEGEAQNIEYKRTGVDPSMWLAVHLPLPNVWLGVSVEDQERADERVPHLLDTPAAMRFLSCEPLLGPVDVSPWIEPAIVHPQIDDPRIGWVICGGESGSRARPFCLDWASSLARQCAGAGVPFFMKQIGARPFEQEIEYLEGRACAVSSRDIRTKDRKGADIAEFPKELQVREFPRVRRAP